MKKYIILGQSILGNGGAQVYYINKRKHLESLGWKVLLFTFHTKGQILYDEFNGDRQYIYPEMEFTIEYFSSKYVSLILHRILAQIECDQGDEIVIESNWVGSATWGERLAELLDAKHVIYLLSESNNVDNMRDFLLFKYNRRELYGISPYVIYQLLGKEYNIALSDCPYISASCYSLSIPVDIDFPIFQNRIKEYAPDYVISYFGRLEKFSEYNLKQIMLFAQAFPNLRILLIGLGYNNLSETYRFNEILQQRPKNLSVDFLKMATPIPKKFFQLSNVVVATAGCARISALQNCLTIAIDAKCDQPIGLLGITTSETTFSDKLEQRPLSIMLEDILIRKLYADKEINKDLLRQNFKEMRNLFIEIIKYDHNGEYYIFSDKSPKFTFTKYSIRKLMIRLIGIKNLLLFRKIK